MKRRAKCACVREKQAIFIQTIIADSLTPAAFPVVSVIHIFNSIRMASHLQRLTEANT